MRTGFLNFGWHPAVPAQGRLSSSRLPLGLELPPDRPQGRAQQVCCRSDRAAGAPTPI